MLTGSCYRTLTWIIVITLLCFFNFGDDHSASLVIHDMLNAICVDQQMIAVVFKRYIPCVSCDLAAIKRVYDHAPAGIAGVIMLSRS